MWRFTCATSYSVGIGQAIAVAYCRAFVFARVNTAILQHRHDLFDKFSNIVWRARRLQGVAVHRAILPEIDNAIRHIFWRAE